LIVARLLFSVVLQKGNGLIGRPVSDKLYFVAESKDKDKLICW